MTNDQIILFVIFGGVFALLIWGRWRYDLVAFGALLVGVLAGVVPSEKAFEGFGHPATLVVALVLVVSAGLVRSGAVFLITRTLIDSARPLGQHITIMGGVGAVLSGFMNNVAALALLMPVDIQTAKKAKRNVALSLMPLSFATILGGMVTMIGTPPNIIIATIRQERLGAPFRMFDFAPVGAIAAIAGLVFVALVGWRLIPRRDDASAGESLMDLKQFVAELSVPEEAGIIGKQVRALYDEAESADVAIIGLVRDGKRRYGTARDIVIRAGDALVIEATPEALEEFRSALSLTFSEGEKQERLDAASEGVELFEVVVPEQARIADKTAQSIGLSWRRDAVLMGISRSGKRITEQVRKTVVRPGDILLLLAPAETARDVTQWLGCLPLAERGLAVTQDGKTWAAIGIFAAAVAAASFGLVYMPVALGVVVALYTITRIIPLSEVYNHIEWPVVVLLGSMIPLGAALESSGGTTLIAGWLTQLTAGAPVWVALTVLMVVTMSLSDVLNNTATAIVAAPVGISMAESLDVSPDPFLMAVAVAASCAFLTPIGHKNNTLILGPGGYAFGDYWRMGLPLEVLVIAVSIPSILVFWPL
ncbi:SLC13/DASS family transporter [Pikeienuella piscinae]|uniref:SLC13/DASS family transporter n=1 Tax=Pikeienuella piscinae TaxID=2748098 RepID=A0A7M3T5F8_9RHOB|nr:SLC13 family permease [Pikeienuella piscinae]QIE57239.1 SLC13/DASS family transporter [Pikeienuella piscinae]